MRFSSRCKFQGRDSAHDWSHCGTAGPRVPLNHKALCGCRGCCSSPPSSPTSLWHTTLNVAISFVIKPLSLVEGIPLWLWADLSAAHGRSHEGESFMSNHKAMVYYNETASRSIKQYKDKPCSASMFPCVQGSLSPFSYFLESGSIILFV